jgi:signal transduction histidine kinase
MHLESVDLAAAVAKARDQLAVDIRERQATIIVQGSMPRVRAHPATLVQIIANLLANAIKFVDTNSRPRVRVWAEESVGGVRLWIEDNGIGIAHEHQDRVFRVFERLHGVETYPGSGIGLAIVRKGTSRMGGLVGVESQPGRGSRFWIELTLNGRNI